jgi:Nucleotidyltransferase domain
MDERAQRYLEEIAYRLTESLGDRLMGVAAIGSYALDAYVPGRSDLDLLVVIDRPLTVADWDAVVDLCSHESLPCPARKLELVAYTRPQVAAPRRNQRWELNLNTGPGVSHAGFDPMAESWHWFVLDLAQAREHAVPLYGPHPRELVGEVKEELIVDALSASVAWYALHEPGAPLLLAAARAWHWHARRKWVSKADAWRWVSEKMGPPA